MSAIISKIRESTEYDHECKAPLYKLEEGKTYTVDEIRTSCPITNRGLKYASTSVLSLLDDNTKTYTDISGVKVKMMVFTHDKVFNDTATVLGESSAYYFVAIDDTDYKIRKANVFFFKE